MQRVRSTGQTPVTPRPCALAIGNFDGVHRGHRAVLEAAVQAARALGGEAWVLTFDPHPARFFRPDSAPPILTSDEQRGRRFARLGLDGWWSMPFDATTAALSPAAFVERLASALPGLGAIRVGADWRFGRGASGDMAMLADLCRPRGISVEGASPVLHDGQPVSSTRIREAIRRGDLETATALFGHPHEVEGRVVRGRGYARTLGFPSANLEPAHDPMLPDGVYACSCEIDGRAWRGAGYVPRGGEGFEVHFAGYSGDLYGRDLTIRVHARLRPDEPTDDEAVLRARIAEDVRRALAHAATDENGP